MNSYISLLYFGEIRIYIIKYINNYSINELVLVKLINCHKIFALFL